jgi:HK97 family phage major capsid protein
VSPASITNGVTPVASSGTNADAVRADLKALWQGYIAANVNPTSAVYIMSPGTALSLSLMLNPLGQAEFPGLNMNGGSLAGVPVVVSQYVGELADTAGDIVILANASDIFLADDGQVVLDASREASLQMLDNPTNHSGTGTATAMVSMFQTNSIALRAERWITWKKRRAQAVAYLSGVNWA